MSYFVLTSNKLLEIISPFFNLDGAESVVQCVDGNSCCLGLNNREKDWDSAIEAQVEALHNFGQSSNASLILSIILMTTKQLATVLFNIPCMLIMLLFTSIFWNISSY